jgi:hypothetical protein
MSCIHDKPEALLRATPQAAEPFSTPRAWASLSRAIDLAERAGVLDGAVMESLARGRLSQDDAQAVCTTWHMARALSARYSFIQIRSVLKESVAILELPVLIVNALELEGINTIGDLARLTEYQLLTVRHFDRARVQEVQAALARFGLSLNTSLA